MPSPEYIQPPETAEEAFEQSYQELSRVTARVINKIVGLHDSNREKTWADVDDLEHVAELMQELDKLLGKRHE